MGAGEGAALSSEVANGVASHPITDPSDSDQSDTTDVAIDGESRPTGGTTTTTAASSATAAVTAPAVGSGKGGVQADAAPLATETSS